MSWAPVAVLKFKPAVLPVFIEWREKCEACRFHERTDAGHFCLRADGKSTFRSCSAMRLDGPCGPDATLYQRRRAKR